MRPEQAWIQNAKWEFAVVELETEKRDGLGVRTQETLGGADLAAVLNELGSEGYAILHTGPQRIILGRQTGVRWVQAEVPREVRFGGGRPMPVR